MEKVETIDSTNTLKSERLQDSCRTFVNWCLSAEIANPTTFDCLASKMPDINHQVFIAETNGISKDVILQELEEVRAIQGKSPFVARLQNWERGYPGDFETIEYLLQAKNKASKDSIAYLVEMYCLNTGIAQQHRNKVRFQADRILQTILQGAKTHAPKKILIIACGSSPDVALIQDLINDCDFQLVLNDMDKDALELSRQKLSGIENKVEFVHGNIFRCAGKLAAFGKFDLIVTGGLFDYLDEKQAVFLTNITYSKLLAPNGKFIFTNIGKPNPYKYWMEYCANWFLIERDETNIEQILLKSDISPESATISKDSTGLTYLVEIENRKLEN